MTNIGETVAVVQVEPVEMSVAESEPTSLVISTLRQAQDDADHSLRSLLDQREVPVTT